MNPWIPVVSAVAAGLLGWWLGTNHVAGKWAKADKEALEAQEQLTQDALDERDTLQVAVNDAARRLAESESKRVTLSNKLQEAINREPIVRNKVREVPADCPACTCPVVDAGPYFRLWNAGLTRADEADVPTITAGFSDGPMWRSCITAGLDGDDRYDQRGGAGYLDP